MNNYELLRNRKTIGLPMDTPAGKMVLSEKGYEQLTPAARKMTKGDLLALGKWGKQPVRGIQELTVKDINSLKTVFGNELESSTQLALAFDDINCCCCCCPCCCAVAVEKPMIDPQSLRLAV